jgi:hypothetical protein
MAKNKALNIRNVLSSLDGNKYFEYNAFSDEQKKEFSPWLVSRYMSSVSGRGSEFMLLSVNKTVNRWMGSLSNHKELVWMLLASCGIGGKVPHVWIAPPKKGTSTLHDVFKKADPTLNDTEVGILLKTMSESDIKQFMIDNGVDDE